MIRVPDQPLAQRILSAAVARERPPQQLLLHGPPGTGKRAAAHAVAGRSSIRRASTGPQASLDLTVIRGTGAVIRLEEIDPVLADLAARPAVGRRRVLVLEEAERLADDQGSRLLKMLEEPPPSSHVVLVTDRPGTCSRPSARAACPCPSGRRAGRWSPGGCRSRGCRPPRPRPWPARGGPLALSASPLARHARALGVELALRALTGGGGADAVRQVQAALETSARESPSAELLELRAEAALKAGRRGERTALKRVEDQEKREVRRAVTGGWEDVLDGMAALVADGLAVCVGAERAVRHRDRLEALRPIAVPARQPFLERAAEEVALTRSELELNPTTDLAVEALLLRLDSARHEGGGRPCRGRPPPSSGAVLVAVVVRLVRALDRDADVVGLLLGEGRQPHAERVEVQAGDLLVEVLRQDVDLPLVVVVLGEQLDLGDHLVGEGVRHHEGRVAGGVAQVQQAALGEHDDRVARRGRRTRRPAA